MRAQCSAAPRAIEVLRGIMQPGLRPRGCFLVNCAFELTPQDAEVSALVHETFVALQGVLAGSVRRAVADGDLPASTRSVDLAAALLAVAQGQLALSRAGVSKAVRESVGRSAARALLGAGEPPVKPAPTSPRTRDERTGERGRRRGAGGRSGAR